MQAGGRGRPEHPRIPAFLRLVTVVECAVVAWAALLMFCLPSVGRELWAWVAPPFNSRFIGCVYFAALPPLVALALTGRWMPGRVVLWMTFTFTTSVMAVMVFYADRFEWGRLHTYGFWVIYLFLPLTSAAYLYRLRSMRTAQPKTTSARRGAALTLMAGLLAAYGVGLLIAPEPLTSFWPWPVDSFHGRIYAATFLTPAVGMWLIRGHDTPLEDATVGMSLLALGVLAIVGVLITDRGLAAGHGVDYGATGTLAFFVLNGLLAAAGGKLIAGLRGGGGMRRALAV